MSKYRGLVEAVKQRTAEEITPEPVAEVEEVTPPPPKPARKVAAPPPAPAPKAAAKQFKRGNPDYQQITAYLPKDLYRQMKMLLARDDREMSDLIETLIREWTARQR